MNERSQLMQRIRMYDFALYDLMLYLDTHPDCRKAAGMFAKYRAEREKAVSEYVEKYGAVKALQTDTSKRWSWGAGPYPWEQEAN